MKKDRKTIRSTTESEPVTNGAVFPSDYNGWLIGLKDRIAAARNRAALSVNQELIRLYHQIGTEILERQTRQGWGAKVIDRLAADLRDAFPDMKGFSVRNLNYMRLFAEQCPTRQFVQQPAAQIGQLSADQLPWFPIEALPEPLDSCLPTIEVLEDELSRDLEQGEKA
jgi:hypothetical protein